MTRSRSPWLVGAGLLLLAGLVQAIPAQGAGRPGSPGLVYTCVDAQTGEVKRVLPDETARCGTKEHLIIYNTTTGAQGTVSTPTTPTAALSPTAPRDAFLRVTGIDADLPVFQIDGNTPTFMGVWRKPDTYTPLFLRQCLEGTVLPSRALDADGTKTTVGDVTLSTFSFGQFSGEMQYAEAFGSRTTAAGVSSPGSGVSKGRASGSLRLMSPFPKLPVHTSLAFDLSALCAPAHSPRVRVELYANSTATQGALDAFAQSGRSLATATFEIDYAYQARTSGAQVVTEKTGLTATFTGFRLGPRTDFRGLYFAEPYEATFQTLSLASPAYVAKFPLS